MKLLIIEDSERLRRFLERGLAGAGFTGDAAADGEEGLAFAQAYEYDAVVLDLMLPRLPGLEVLRRLRRRGSALPVLILSARDQVEDRVRGLELGADDYLVKPFALDELVARLRALIRRRFDTRAPSIEIGPLEIDTARREVRRDGAPVPLTRSEYELLERLAFGRGRVHSQAQLAELLHPGTTAVTLNLVEKLVSTLRKKIDRPGADSLIHTRRGFGYVIE